MVFGQVESLGPFESRIPLASTGHRRHHGSMRNPWILPCFLALAPSESVAQVVVGGEVLEAETLAPLAGAMVTLSEAGGEPVDRVLTNATGRFVTEAAHPGHYEIRVDRIGYASLSTEPFEVGVAGTFRTVEVPIQPIELAGLDVEGVRRCELRPEEGRVTALVWEEARKALEAAQWTQSRGLYLYTLLHYVRDLDRSRERIESEERTSTRGSSSAPFVSVSAEELAAKGFVHLDEDSPNDDYVFFAPDAEVLLSDAFLDTHCLGVERGEEGTIGLTFELVDGRRLPDIEGVIWLDERTAFLQHLEFRYVNLPWRREAGDSGGEVIFTALPNGTWIVREFRIRMPMLESYCSPGACSLRRVGYRDEGGIAWRISYRTGETILEADTGTASGTVVDSTGAAPDPR